MSLRQFLNLVGSLGKSFQLSCALRWATSPRRPTLIKTKEKQHKHNQAKYLQNRSFA
jgi:hypothetical protein